jgi:uncharacterized membrane protein
MLRVILAIATVPVILAGSGLILLLRPPKNINGVYGFRTRLASKSERTWAYANGKAARLLVLFGIISLLLNVIIYVVCAYAFSAAGAASILAYTSIVCILFALFAVYYIVQYGLRKRFHEKGSLKEK